VSIPAVRVGASRSKQPEAFAVPGDDDLRLDDDQGGAPVSPDFAEPGPEESIGGGQTRPLDRAMQDAELVAKGQVFQLQRGSRFQQ